MAPFDVRPYRSEDEQGWLRCRALSFLGSAYYDDVVPEKPSYDGPTIELVAADGQEIVGLRSVPDLSALIEAAAAAPGG